MDTQEGQKKKFYKRWWFWVMCVVVAFIIVGAMGETEPTATVTTQAETESTVAKEENKPASATTQAQPVKTETPKPAPQTARSYQRVFTFSGNGAKKSEPFTITGDRFKIAYDCSGDPNFTLCQAFLYEVGSNLPQVVMNSPDPTKDETIIYGKGEYYIDANTIGNYTMTVYDYK